MEFVKFSLQRVEFSFTEVKRILALKHLQYSYNRFVSYIVEDLHDVFAMF